MSSPLIPCPRCERHILAHEASCPFCRATLGGGGGLAAVVALSAGLSLAGCTPEPPAPLYGGPPPPVATPVMPVTAPPQTAVPVPAYGTPPPPMIPPPATSATASGSPRLPRPSAPAYGAPPKRSP